MTNSNDNLNKDIKLSDAQYIEILDKIEQEIKSGTEYWVEDDTTVGAKNTYSSIGLCNDEKFTTEDNSLWPERYNQGVKTMKYKKLYHYCPFDSRILDKERQHDMNGCYYSCLLRRDKKLKTKPIKINAETAALLLNLAKERMSKRSKASEKYLFECVDKCKQALYGENAVL